jgi:hypothetical protein
MGSDVTRQLANSQEHPLDELDGEDCDVMYKEEKKKREKTPRNPLGTSWTVRSAMLMTKRGKK